MAKYYYDKYYAYLFYRKVNELGLKTDIEYPEDHLVYGYSPRLNVNSGVFEPVGTGTIHNDAAPPFYGIIRYTGKKQYAKYTRRYDISTGHGTSSTAFDGYVYEVGEGEYGCGYTKLETIEAEDGTYPRNGKQGQYWYIRAGLVNRVPTISDTNRNLGDYNKGFTIKNTVSDEDGDRLKAVVKLNNIEIKSDINIASGTEVTTTITDEQLYKLVLNEINNLVITIDDGKGGTATRSYTFRRVNAVPIISGEDKSLGTFKETFSYSYTVSDVDKDIMSVVERLDNNVIKTHNNVVSGTELTITFTNEEYFKMADGKKHTIQIEARDNNGATSFRNIEFIADSNAPTIKFVNKNLAFGRRLTEFPKNVGFSISDKDVELGVDKVKVTIGFTFGGKRIEFYEKENFEVNKTIYYRELEEFNRTWDAMNYSINDGIIYFYTKVEDSKGKKDENSIPFFKIEDTIDVKFKEPRETEILLEMIVPVIHATYDPETTILKVFVTNNGLDPNPVWEEVTKEAINMTEYYFDNKESINKPAFDMHVIIEPKVV